MKHYQNSEKRNFVLPRYSNSRTLYVKHKKTMPITSNTPLSKKCTIGCQDNFWVLIMFQLVRITIWPSKYVMMLHGFLIWVKNFVDDMLNNFLQWDEVTLNIARNSVKVVREISMQSHNIEKGENHLICQCGISSWESNSSTLHYSEFWRIISKLKVNNFTAYDKIRNGQYQTICWGLSEITHTSYIIFKKGSL